MKTLEYLRPAQVARKERFSVNWIHRILRGETKKKIDAKYILKVAGFYFIREDYKIEWPTTPKKK